MIYSPTHDNLRSFGTPLLGRLLAQAALERSALTYGRAAAALESAGPFTRIFSTEMGVPAGNLMHRIHENNPKVPLLNVLLVRQDTRYPGNGAGGFLARWFGKEALAGKDVWRSNPKLWRKYCDRAITEVYSFEDWHRVIDNTFGPGSMPEHVMPQERDGTAGGEGEPHRKLRLWATANPGALDPCCANYTASTEVTLLSGDRVDVMLRGPEETVCIEVKSYTSSEADLERGIYQCIKYRAVVMAMDARRIAPVRTILVTQAKLPGYLSDLANLHGVATKQAPHPLPKNNQKAKDATWNW